MDAVASLALGCGRTQAPNDVRSTANNAIGRFRVSMTGRIIGLEPATGNVEPLALQSRGLESDGLRAQIARMTALYALLAGGIAPLGFWLAKGSC
ncbi:MAG: hypothetical protein ACKO4Q_01495 [Planctomycetota bacterium]